MTATADPVDQPGPKKSKMPLILGLVLAIAGGGGGFMAVQMGLLGGGGGEQEAHAADASVAEPMAPLAFVALDPLVISLMNNGMPAHLRFSAQLEVAPEYQLEVEAQRPRIVDVLNTYLRAVTVPEMRDPAALGRLRGQMLRRVQLIAGEGRVRDLLIMEFVLD